jgi:hypothetical protein
MLLILLAGLLVVWVAVIVAVVALCAGAARGDRELRDARSDGGRRLRLIAG